jgi:hypothetical protein
MKTDSQPLGSGEQYCSDRYETFVDNAAATEGFQSNMFPESKK